MRSTKYEVKEKYEIRNMKYEMGWWRFEISGLCCVEGLEEAVVAGFGSEPQPDSGPAPVATRSFDSIRLPRSDSRPFDSAALFALARADQSRNPPAEYYFAD